MRTYKDAKVMAKCLRQLLSARAVSLSHSESLEIVAQQLGFGDWNTLAAKLDFEGGRLSQPQDAYHFPAARDPCAARGLAPGGGAVLPRFPRFSGRVSRV